MEPEGATGEVGVAEAVQVHSTMLASLGAAMDNVLKAVQRLELSQQHPATPAVSPPALASPPAMGPLHLPLPRDYNGAVDCCQGFLLQLDIALQAMHPAPTEAQKITSLVSCLSGKALEWATAIWNTEQPTQGSYAEFTRRFRAVFDHPHEGREAGERLFHLRQGTRSAQEFALEFRTLAAGSGWNERALIDHYRCSLREDVRRELACRDVSLSLDQLVDKSIRLDNLLAARGRPGRGPSVPPYQPYQPDTAVPMELGAAALPGRRRGGQVRSASRGQRGHITAPHRTSLPESRGDRQGTSASPQVAHAHSPLTSSLSMCTVPVRFPGFPLLARCKALVDSGAAGNFMDRSFALRSHIPLQALDTPLPVRALDSRPLGSGLVTSCTVPLLLITDNRHSETISFHVIDSPTFPVVLGFPWLSLHDPIISWSSRRLSGWSRKCQGRCLGVSVGSTSVESPDSAPAVPIPPEYRDLATVFSKAKAAVLPPHRLGDCAIDLVDGAALPKGHVYPLSRTETETMNAYVTEALEQGYIRPSKS
uniref:Retrotransposon gag domain-containing protein n=1 Tax=Esox lucius TaxID=8010 RepID=A0A6Q2ZMK7_ESOLU